MWAYLIRVEGIEDEREDTTLKEETVVTAAGRAAETSDEDNFRPNVQVSSAYCSHLFSIAAERALRTVLYLEKWRFSVVSVANAVFTDCNHGAKIVLPFLTRYKTTAADPIVW